MPDIPADRRSLPNFNRVARLYRWAEYLLLGPLLQQTRVHFLPQLPHAGTAIILGDGDGRFTAELLRQRPKLHVVAVDGSSSMLRLLRNHCRFALDRLVTQQADLRQPAPWLATLPASRLIVSHFVLDCLTEPQVAQLAHTLRAHSAPGTQWLVSDFAVPQKQPWRALGIAYIRLLYLAFRALTGLSVQRLPALQPILAAAGWQPQQRASRLGGLLFSQLWAAPHGALEPGFSTPDATAPTPQSSTLG